MCSEIDHYSSVLRRMSENLTSFPEFVSETETVDKENPDHQKKPEEIKDREGEEEEEEEEETDPEATVSDRKSDKQISEDDDGFKTPTSSDHRIPAPTQCPPAPRKPRPPPSSLKRKASTPRGACRSLQFDASTAEVESIFGPIPNDQDDAQDQKIKKSRTDDKDRL